MRTWLLSASGLYPTDPQHMFVLDWSVGADSCQKWWVQIMYYSFVGIRTLQANREHNEVVGTPCSQPSFFLDLLEQGNTWSDICARKITSSFRAPVLSWCHTPLIFNLPKYQFPTVLSVCIIGGTRSTPSSCRQSSQRWTSTTRVWFTAPPLLWPAASACHAACMGTGKASRYRPPLICRPLRRWHAVASEVWSLVRVVPTRHPSEEAH